MPNTEADVSKANVEQDKILHVAVGVITNISGEILISLRQDTAHQGGLWEFPGGKVEPGETVRRALARELQEELNISIIKFHPLIKINHQYSDLKVLLDVWSVSNFFGNPISMEGQEILWVSPDQLTDYSFPEANYPIINAARLASEYAILNGDDINILLQDLSCILNQDVKLIQARIKSLSTQTVKRFCELAIPLCKTRGAILLLNSSTQGIKQLEIDGIHLTAKDLLSLNQRPAGYQWVAASCHNDQELQHAERIGVDFIVLAPVLPTKTHPDSIPLGWEKFKQLIDRVNVPVYALGGMSRHNITHSQSVGAQGIAGIRAFLV